MQHVFHGCRDIRYINMANFNDINLQKYDYIFTDISKNIVICINENLNTKIINAIRQINCSIIDCSNVWVSKQKKIINENNQCIDNCINSTQYQYEYNDKCYSNCPNGLLSDNTNIINNKCKCELEKCLKCPTIALSLNLCTECNNNYYLLLYL